MMPPSRTTATILVVLTAVVLSDAFMTTPASRTLTKVGSVDDNNNENGDFPPAVEYSGSVDWDAEWKKVVAKESDTAARPGKGYYKSEAEIATIVR